MKASSPERKQQYLHTFSIRLKAKACKVKENFFPPELGSFIYRML